MTDQQHPITPSPELVQQWRQQMPVGFFDGYKYPEREKALCLVAARWGADQELEACITWVAIESLEAAKELRAARRPKPPSLKEQAMALIDGCNDPHGDHLDDAALDTIRRALEQLDD